MKTKAFVHRLTEYIFEEYKKEIPQEELKSSFVAAIKKVKSGKLRDELNRHFDKYLKKLERDLKSLCVTELPSVSNGTEDSLEELTKSELDGRTDVEEKEPGKNKQKLLYNMLGTDIQTLKKQDVQMLDEKQRHIDYRTFIQKLLNKEHFNDKMLDKVLEDFEKVCSISKEKQPESSKKRFDWFPQCDFLLQLCTGSRPVAFIRVLKRLFDAVQNDANKCITSHKVLRAGSLQKILKKFLTETHHGVDKSELGALEIKTYIRYMAALLSLYVDLGCTVSSNSNEKKLVGKEMSGFVCYLLQRWPESLLEVVLQLQTLDDEHYTVLLPLINKSLETKPQGSTYEHYLKYVLLVRLAKDAFVEKENIIEWNFATKRIPAKIGFLDWLEGQCPEALEHIPVEDKKFKKTRITRFLLEEAEDDLISTLLDSLSKDEEKDEPSDKDVFSMETSAPMATDDLFYLDIAGSSSVLDLADSPEKSSKKGASKHKPIVLKTLADIEKIVDAGVVTDGTRSPQTYTLDPKFIRDKVKDAEDRKFFESEIVSITSLNSFDFNEADKGAETVYTNSPKCRGSEKAGKWTVSSSSTPNSRQKNKRGEKNDLKNDGTELSEQSEDFVDSMTSISEDEHKIKSVVRKVTPSKSVGKQIGNQNMKKMSPSLNRNDLKSRDTQEKISAKSVDEVICIESDSESQENCYEISSDRLTTDENETLSTIHESSVEIRDIVLEPADQDMEISEDKQNVTDNTKDKVSKGRKNNSKSSVLSPKGKASLKSPKLYSDSRTSLSVNSSKTDSIVSGSFPSCISEISSTTLISGSSLFTDSSQDDTVKFASDQTASQHSTSDSDILSDSPNLKPRKQSDRQRKKDIVGKKDENQKGSGSDTSVERRNKSTRKSSSGNKQVEAVDKRTEQNSSDVKQLDDKTEMSKAGKKLAESSLLSPKERARKSSKTLVTESPINKLEAEKYTDDSDGEVFKKATEKEKGTPGVKCKTSMQEKFIGKAIKGRKTPKKSNKQTDEADIHVSGSVSLFPDEVSETADARNNKPGNAADKESGPRSKSTEEIFQIVSEIKEKIKSPIKRKSISKGKEKMNDSMFTDDSIESSQDENNLSGKDTQSPLKKRKGKSDSENEKQKAVTEKNKDKKTSTRQESPKKVKPQEVVVIDLIDGESDSQTETSEVKHNSAGNSGMNEAKHSNEKSLLEGVKNSIIAVMEKTPKSKSQTKSQSETVRSPSQGGSISDFFTKLKSPQASQSDSSPKTIKSPNVTRLQDKPDKVTPGKKAGVKSLEDQENGRKPVIDKISKSPKGSLFITDSETETEKAKANSRTPKGKNDNFELNKQRTPRSMHKSECFTESETDTEKTKIKSRTPKGKESSFESGEKKKSASESENELKEVVKAPKPEKQLSDVQKTPKSEKTPKQSQLTPKQLERTPKQSEKTPKQSEKTPKQSGKTPKQSEKTPKQSEETPKQSQLTPKQLERTPKQSEKTPKQSDKTPKQSEKTPKQSEKTPKQSGKTPKQSEKTPEQSEKTPKQSQLTPKQLERTPKQSEKTPKQSEKTPKQSEKTPKQSEKTPKQSEKTPKLSKTPDQQSEKKMLKSPRSDSKQSTNGETMSSKTLPVSSPETKSVKYKSPKPFTSPDGKRKSDENIADDFVPSSQKKSRNTNVDSDSEGILSIPNIGIHLKSPRSQSIDGESPLPQANMGVNSPGSQPIGGKSPAPRANMATKSPKRGKLEATPQKELHKTTGSPLPSLESKNTVELGGKTRRSTRGKTLAEPDSTASDTDGPSRPKRLRAGSKPLDNATEKTDTKGRATRASDFKKGSKSDTDTDMSDVEPRRTRKSLGVTKAAAAKAPSLASVDEEQAVKLNTTPAKTQKPRKLSASTTKKATKLLEETRGTRKRRLSGELSEKAGTDVDSDSSEIVFPKLKPLTKERRSSKRLSMSEQTQPDTDGKRYSLRKK